eukprot:TRINITY_DN63471_c0_g1_i1.p1 TRINITY_DN63471_c0_g1~~TRINITY_DN63471_c0_g1_i1.p1  ORF type:complete len:496 (+),score=90.49 TRINITY_DN63471_c0_g1_i1:39-1526(+)
MAAWTSQPMLPAAAPMAVPLDLRSTAQRARSSSHSGEQSRRRVGLPATFAASAVWCVYGSKRASRRASKLIAHAAIAWDLRLAVWKARVRRNLRWSTKKALQGTEVPDLDLNVLPPVLPHRPPLGAVPSVTQKVWRKIVYWAKLRDGITTRQRDLNGDAPKQQVAVLGGGAFGTAMAAHIARKGNKVTMIIRDKNVSKFINEKHINPRYLSEFDLPQSLRATTDPAEAIAGCDTFVHALPVQASREALSAVRHLLPRGTPVVAVSKGIELGSRRLMCDLIPQAIQRREAENPVVCVSGPSFAEEIMDRRPTSVVAASHDAMAAEKIQRLLTSKYFRVSITDDVLGVEVAGALKNVLAIAAGICEGLGLGTNAMSALVTQGNAEIRWLATAMGARSETLAGLSGMGDILLTCFGSLSRNRSVGVRLGRGESLEDVLNGKGGVAEGVYTARLVVELADEYRVLLPVLTSVARILSREVSARQAVFEVLALPTMTESA